MVVKKKNGSQTPIAQIVVLLLILIGIIIAVAIFLPKGIPEVVVEQENIIEIPEGLTEEDAIVLQDLRSIFELPEDIVPLMAVITNLDDVKAQQPDFFKNAKHGQRVIVYPHITILFDPIQKKIVNAGNVKLTAQLPNPLDLVTFTILNGSGRAGSAASYAEKLNETFNNVETTLGNAAALYDQTFVADVLGNNPEIQRIADGLGIKISDVPEEEGVLADTMVLIIVGSDYDPEENSTTNE